MIEHRWELWLVGRLMDLVREASKQPAERAADARRVLVSYRLLPWVE